MIKFSKNLIQIHNNCLYILSNHLAPDNITLRADTRADVPSLAFVAFETPRTSFLRLLCFNGVNSFYAAMHPKLLNSS